MTTTHHGRLRLDGYVRVSKVGGREGEGYITEKVQAEALTAWAEGRGHTITVHPPERDKSGGTMSRPVFDSILRRIESGESDGIVVFKVDRFARSLLGALQVLEVVAAHHGTFASVSDNIDMTTAQGRAFLNMQLVFAQLFREQIGESFDVATGRAVARGVHIANSVNVGYDRVDQRLVPNAHAPAVRELFERRAKGAGISELARWLDTRLPRHELPTAEGKPAHREDECWTPAQVASMLKMRAYMGEAHYGKHSNPHAHEAIVSETLFLRASEARAPSPSRGDVTHLLAGLIRCAGCRYIMTPAKSGPTGAKVLVYRCRQRHTAGACKAPATVNRDRVEAFVEEAVLRKLSGHEAFVSGDGDEHLRALARRDDLRAELDAFAADMTARELLGDMYHAAMASRVSALREADSEVARTASVDALPNVTREEWASWPVADRREVIAQMTDAVFVRKLPGKPRIEDRAFVAFRGSWEGYDDLPRRGRDNGSVVPFFPWPHAERDPGVPSS